MKGEWLDHSLPKKMYVASCLIMTMFSAAVLLGEKSKHITQRKLCFFFEFCQLVIHASLHFLFTKLNCIYTPLVMNAKSCIIFVSGVSHQGCCTNNCKSHHISVEQS